MQRKYQPKPASGRKCHTARCRGAAAATENFTSSVTDYRIFLWTESVEIAARHPAGNLAAALIRH
jgi:hypothetical protein